MISEHYTPEAVILANGEYPTHVLPLKILEEAKFVVCCDGAANEYILRGHTPDIIIGDGDSLSPENKTRFSDIIHHIADQETNDQTKAVHFLQEKRLPENSHRRCYRKTGRPHIRKYQFAAGLYEKRYGSTNRYGLRSIYSGKRHADFRFSHRPANFHYQFRSERIERGRIGLSA